MAQGSWGDFQRRNIERFGEGQDRAWFSTVEFWKHLVMVEATVLGLTVGLIGARRDGAPSFLILAWVALLLGIFVGCLLIRGGIEAEQSRRYATFLTSYDIAEIRGRVDAGELGVESEEYQGLLLAAVIQSTPEWEFAKIFTPKAKELAGPWFAKLPSARLVRKRESAIFKWLEQHLMRAEAVFYSLSAVAFVLMVLTVVGPPRREIAQGTMKVPDSVAIKMPNSAAAPAASRDSARRSTPRSP